jgi:O-antigen ligase
MSVALPSPAKLGSVDRGISLPWAVSSAISTLLLVLLPLAAPIVLLTSTAVLLAFGARPRKLFVRPPAVLVALAVIGLYLLINASWSLSLKDAFRAIGVLSASIGILYLTLNALEDGDQAVLRSIAAGLVAGLAVGGIVLCIEAFSGLALLRWLIGYFPALTPHENHIIVWGNGTITLRPHLLNRSITLFTLLFWPALLTIDRCGLSPRQKAWAIAALAPGVAALLRSEHGTSKLAFGGAVAIYALYFFYPLLAGRITRVAWIAIVLLVVPAVSLIYSAQLYRATWLPMSAQHRIVIWGYTAEQIAKAPLLGAGIATARALHDPEEFNSPNTPLVPGTKFPATGASHSHNAYLQVWYEAGAFGALLLLGFGLILLQALDNQRQEARPYLHATFAACALLAASAFSIWAPWLLAAFCIVAICAATAVALRAPQLGA